MLIVVLVLIVLAVLLVANLLLTVALAQRVRAIETSRGGSTGHEHGPAEHGLVLDPHARAPAAGTALPAFRVPEQGSDADYRAGSVLVAFFSTDCRGCAAAMPDFARTSVHDYDRVLAVIKGSEQPQADELIEQLMGTPAVVASGAAADTLWQTFEVSISPSFYEYRDGTLTAAHLGYGQFRSAVLRAR